MNKNSSILAISVNARYTHSNYALFILKKMMADNNIDSSLLELTIGENIQEMLEKILLLKDSGYPGTAPGTVLFSVYIWNSEIILQLSKLLRELSPGTIQILGGPEVTYNTELWKNKSCADYLVCGPGESIILELIDSRKREYSPVIINSPAIDINKIPFPYTKVDLERLKNRLVYYETSRGCPFRCSYCQSAISGNDLQLRDIEKVKEEIKILAFSGAKIIKLVDRSFNCKPERARKIWKHIMELDGSVPFHCEIHPLFLQDEDFTLLSKAPERLFHFEVGIQSTSDRVLNAVNRKGSWSKIREKIERLINDTGIPVHLDQIAALPYSDMESVIQSFNDIIRLKPDEFQMGFLKVLPGTPLEKEFSSQLVHSEKTPYEVLQTETLSFKDIRYLHKIESLLGRYYNSGKFKNSIDYLFDSQFIYSKEPFKLFEHIESVIRCKRGAIPGQWAKLAELLLETVQENFKSSCIKVEDNRIKQDAEYLLYGLKDTLREDWAPMSQGQYLPSFLNYSETKTIKELRRRIQPLCSGYGIKNSDFKKGILIVMEHKASLVKINEMIEDPAYQPEQSLEDSHILFSVPVNKSRRNFWFSL